MRINFGIPQNNKLFNFSNINKHSNSDHNHQNSKATDRVSFSKSGRFSSMLEGFNKQKYMIIERKNEVVNKHLENGGELDDIDAAIDFYDEQIESIDKNISDLFAKQYETILDNDTEEKKSDETKTKEEIETKKINNIANAHQDLKNNQKVASVIKGKYNDVSISKSEAHIEDLRAESLKDNLIAQSFDESSSFNVTDSTYGTLKEAANNKLIDADTLLKEVLDMSKDITLKDSLDALNENNEMTKPLKDDDNQSEKNTYKNATTTYN